MIKFETALDLIRNQANCKCNVLVANRSDLYHHLMTTDDLFVGKLYNKTLESGNCRVYFINIDETNNWWHTIAGFRFDYIFYKNIDSDRFPRLVSRLRPQQLNAGIYEVN